IIGPLTPRLSFAHRLTRNRAPAVAARHYRRALALGLSSKGREPFLLQDATIIQCLGRMDAPSSLPVKNESVFANPDIPAIAPITFLLCCSARQSFAAFRSKRS